jgi:hypothetical protein
MMYEARLESVVGVQKCREMGFDEFAVIAGYRPWYPVGKIDPKIPFVIDSDKESFRNTLRKMYPGDQGEPIFMGAIRRNFFLPIGAGNICHVGQ